MGLNLKDHNLQDMGIGKLKANVPIFDTIYERYLWIWIRMDKGMDGWISLFWIYLCMR